MSSNNTNAVELFGTDGCRLCDEARALLAPICQRLGKALLSRDILDDPTLETAYWDRIPVARRQDNGAELGWPFSSEDAYRFLM